MTVSGPVTKTHESAPSHTPAPSNYVAAERASISDERAAIAGERDRLVQARTLTSEPNVPDPHQMDRRALLVAARLRDEAAIIRDLAANRRDMAANRAAAVDGTGSMAMLLEREFARSDRAASRFDRMASASDRWRLAQRTVPAVTTR